MDKQQQLEADCKKALQAIDILAKGEVPDWLTWIEKKAYALGVITDADLQPHDHCQGRGWLPTFNPYSSGDACYCPRSNGKVIALGAKLRIKEFFPEYDPPRMKHAHILAALEE